MPDYGIFQIIRQYLCWPKFWPLVYWGCTTIKGVFQLDISFICRLRVIRVPLCIFCSLHSLRNWWNMGQGSRRYQYSWCTDTVGGLFEMSLRPACFIDEVFFPSYNTIMYFYCYVYVFLLLYTFCSVYSIFIMPNGTLRLSWLRFFRAFSSVVRQMPGCNSQRWGTACTLPN